MPRTSVIVNTAIRSAILKMAANLTAQVLARYKAETPAPFDYGRVAEFIIFGFLSATVGCFWQEFLEDMFPTRGTRKRLGGVEAGVPLVRKDHDDDLPQTKEAVAAAAGGTPTRVGESGVTTGPTNWWNVFWKLLIDQTAGLFITTTLFLIVMNVAHVHSAAELGAAIRAKVFRIIRAGWNLWPAVALINFLWVPVERRVLVGACVGFGWNIFLSIITMVK